LGIFDRSENDLEKCGANAKLRTIGRQLDYWWGSFWSQEELAKQKIDERREENWLELKKQALAMRFNWEIGSYYDAGMRVGNVWSIEIG